MGPKKTPKKTSMKPAASAQRLEAMSLQQLQEEVRALDLACNTTDRDKCLDVLTKYYVQSEENPLIDLSELGPSTSASKTNFQIEQPSVSFAATSSHQIEILLQAVMQLKLISSTITTRGKVKYF